MKIKLVYDASVAGAPASFTSVLNQGVQFLEQTFTNPITINIEVGWGEIGGTPLDPGVTGEGGPLGGTLYTYGQVKAALASNVASAVDATAVASLPATAPTGGGDFYLGGAEEKALGLIGAAAGIGLVMLAPLAIGLLAHLIGVEWGRLIYILAAVYAIFAFGEMIPLVLSNYTFMFFTVAGLALATPNPNTQLWLLVEAVGGGLLIGATIVVGRIIGAPSATEAAH